MSTFFRGGHGAKPKGNNKPIQGRPSLGIGRLGRGLMDGITDATQALAKVTVGTVKATGTVADRVISAPTDLLKARIYPTIRGEDVKEREMAKAVGTQVTKIKSEQEVQVLLECLSTNFLFTNLEPEQLQSVADTFEKVSVKSGETIIQQGDPGDYFYVLYKGHVEFLVDSEVVGSSADAKETVVFGELALLYASPRAATVQATSDCTLLRLDQANFRHVLRTQGTEADDARMTTLKTVPELAELDETSLRKLVSGMSMHTFGKGEVLFEKGTELNAFIVVQSGKVLATDIQLGGRDYEDMMIGPGEATRSFGWIAMVGHDDCLGHVVATTDVTVLAITRDVFVTAVGNLDELTRLRMGRTQLQQIRVFRDSQLTSEQVHVLLDLMHHRRYKSKRTILRQGDKMEAAMYFVRTGSVTIFTDKGKTQNVMETGGYFGEDNMLLDQNKSGTGRATLLSTMTVVVEAQTKLDVLYLEECRDVIDTRVIGLGKPTTISAIDTSLKWGDLTRHTMLGAGSFGQVWLATAPSPDAGQRRIFALKVQSKHQLCESGQASGVVAERNIMTALKSPFILRLFNTFQDKQRVYMVMSLLQGGELDSLIPEEGLYESAAKFYAAGILEGLTYMHRRHIIHRDLKPENVLIDSKGYPVLIDLGFAKYVPGKTFTFCGTPMYIAPEIVGYKRHDKGCDHWSWANLVYEMVTGKYAFYRKGMDELALFKRICKGTFELEGYMSFEFRLLMISMLAPDPALRLGSRPNGWKDIFASPWFANDEAFSLQAVRQRTFEAPWIPDLKNPLDSSNFRNAPNVEDKMKVTEPPITEKQQQIFTSFGPHI